MHAPCGDARSHGLSCTCQALVRFLVYHRIKPHAPPLVRAPVNSFEFHPCEHTPQAVHLSRWLRHRAPTCPTPSAHRLQRGLPGYLILFAPHAFAPQRQSSNRSSPSPPVFFLISTDFTPTPGIPASPQDPSPSVSSAHAGLSPAISHQTSRTAYTPFTPNNSEQRSPHTYYRGCWHVIGRGLFAG